MIAALLIGLSDVYIVFCCNDESCNGSVYIHTKKLIFGAFKEKFFIIFLIANFSLFVSISYRMKIHKNGNASEVLKSISSLDNSNKQC